MPCLTQAGNQKNPSPLKRRMCDRHSAVATQCPSCTATHQRHRRRLGRLGREVTTQQSVVCWRRSVHSLSVWLTKITHVTLQLFFVLVRVDVRAYVPTRMNKRFIKFDTKTRSTSKPQKSHLFVKQRRVQICAILCRLRHAECGKLGLATNSAQLFPSGTRYSVFLFPRKHL